MHNLTCIVNRNRMLFCDRHKPIPRSNTVKIPNVTALTSAKHSDRDTEPAYFIRLIKLYIAWAIKTSQVTRYSMELRNKQHKRNVRAVWTVGILWGISERVVTKLITNHRCLFSALCLPLGHSNSTVLARINTIQSAVKSSCTVQIVGKTVCVAISESWTESIALASTVVPSKSLYIGPDESSWHPTIDSSKASCNVIPLICDNIMPSYFQKNLF